MATLFIISNPTQYLNAIELVTQFPNRFTNNKLVVITDFTEGIERIDQILAKSYWDEKKMIPLRSSGYAPSDWRSWRHAYLAATEYIKTITYDQLVLGNLGDPLIYAILQTVYNPAIKPVVVDDGTPTINILACRRQGLDFKRFHSPRGIQLIKSLLAFRFYIGFKKPLKSYEFFTLFPAEASNQDIVVLNKMLTLKSFYQNQSINQKIVYFVGSQIVDKGMVDEMLYLNALKNIVADFQSRGKQVQYIIHRSQSKAFQNKVSEIVETISFNLPLEFALRDREVPGTFAGFFSTALFTLNAIHSKSNVIAFEFPSQALHDSKLESIQDVLAIYSLLKNTDGIKIRTIETSGRIN